LSTTQNTARQHVAYTGGGSSGWIDSKTSLGAVFFSPQLYVITLRLNQNSFGTVRGWVEANFAPLRI